MEKRRFPLFTGMVLMSLLLMGHGLTGDYLLGYRADACETTSDCSNNEVCCMFFEENYGICDEQKNCEAIKSVTREEKQGKISSLKPEGVDKKVMLTKAVSAQRSPVVPGKNYSIWAGLILLLLAVVIFMWDTGVKIRKSKKKK
jgi:hypothetical protein